MNVSSLKSQIQNENQPAPQISLGKMQKSTKSLTAMQAIPEHKNEEQDSDFDSPGRLSPDEKTKRNILGSDKE